MNKTNRLGSLEPASTMFRYRALAARAGVATALSLAFGCGETVDDALGGGGEDFSAIYTEMEASGECSGCHAPNAPGIVAGIETTQDWSTEARAKSTLRGNAAGMIGNNEGCNGVPLVGDTADDSLLVAAFDEDVREGFELAAFPDCTADAIADQTLKTGGPLPSGLLADLKAWINAGAP